MKEETKNLLIEKLSKAIFSLTKERPKDAKRNIDFVISILNEHLARKTKNKKE